MGTDCPICLGESAANKCITPCGHLFHTGCLARWIYPALLYAYSCGPIKCESTPISTCPCCRSELEYWFVVAVLRDLMLGVNSVEPEIVCTITKRE